MKSKYNPNLASKKCEFCSGRYVVMSTEAGTFKQCKQCGTLTK